MFSPSINKQDYFLAIDKFQNRDYEKALEYFYKFKREQLDPIPYLPGSEKGYSPTLIIDYYIGTSNCLKKLGKDKEAVSDLKRAANLCQTYMGRQSRKFKELQEIYAGMLSATPEKKAEKAVTEKMSAIDLNCMDPTLALGPRRLIPGFSVYQMTSSRPVRRPPTKLQDSTSGSSTLNRGSKTIEGKAFFDRKAAHVNIGTIGHVDHGKTSSPGAPTRTSAYK